MASPPNPAPSTNPQKRPSLPLSPSSTAAPYKRRKPSTTLSSAAAGSTHAHPLRQTSFPPEEQFSLHDALRSPSVESSVAGGGGTSVAGASVGGGSTRGRGRPRKSAGGGKGRRGGDEDGRSVRSGKSGKGRGTGGEGTGSGSVGGGGGNGGAGEEGAEGEEEEELDEGGMAVMAGAEGGGEAERAAEKKRMAFVFLPSPCVLHGVCGSITNHGGLMRVRRTIQCPDRRLRPRPAGSLRHVPPGQAEEGDGAQGPSHLSPIPSLFHTPSSHKPEPTN